MIQITEVQISQLLVGDCSVKFTLSIFHQDIILNHLLIGIGHLRLAYIDQLKQCILHDWHIVLKYGAFGDRVDVERALLDVDIIVMVEQVIVILASNQCDCL